MMYDKKLWEECIKFHGHGCSGLAIGFKAALAGMKKLGLGLENRDVDEELLCVAENDACGVDSIQWITGCTLGKGNMIIRLTGKPAWSFYDRKTGNSVRVVRRSDTWFANEEENLVEKILNSSDEELFDFKEVKAYTPEKARIFESALCTVCGEYAREDLLRMHNGKLECLDCFNEYDRN